jgi:Sel1 repeat-containing protein
LPRTDDCKSSSILPREELNPLVNPLLGQNLGRWAEVYFTAAPDKREEAVQELLRQLQAENPNDDPIEDAAGDETLELQPPNREMPPPQDHSHEKRVPAPGSLADLAGKVALAENAQSENGESSDPIAAHADQPCDSLPERFLDPAPEQSYLGRIDRLAPQPRAIPAPEPSMPAATDPTPLLRSLLAAPPQPERLRSLRRIPAFAFIAALAMVALAAGYFARGTRHADVVRTETQSATPASAVIAKPAGSNHPDAALLQTTSTMQKASGASISGGSETNSPASTDGSADTASAVVSKASLRGAVPESPNGSQELNLARNYLSGSDGKPRDSAEAAKWLWKAVAKQNVEASDLLSSLYLSGDGVPKNCDQARLLLDAAARKGRSQAAERLTHLQAFGCE